MNKNEIIPYFLTFQIRYILLFIESLQFMQETSHFVNSIKVKPLHAKMTSTICKIKQTSQGNCGFANIFDAMQETRYT